MSPSRFDGGSSTLDVEVQLQVVLAEKTLSLEEVLDLGPRRMLEFPKNAEAPLDLILGGTQIGRGHAVELGDRLGFLVEEFEEPRVLHAPGPAS
jgi:flagellar motor switch/type III secretory pathway protein FliN